MNELHTKYKALFLLFVVFGVYYPALFAGFNLVDDVETFGRLDDAVGFNVAALFLEAGGGYFRPLTTLTFFFDKVCWGLDPGFMHLENILLHAINVLLVFFVAEGVFSDSNIRKYELPLLSGLFFGLHPVNTEAVTWISGRYDLLATFFVLVAARFIQKGVTERRYRHFILSSGLLFAGCLAKESALFFFPVALFLLYSSAETKPSFPGQEAVSFKEFARASVPFAVALISYFILRMPDLRTGDSAIGYVLGRVIQGSTYDLSDTLKIALKVFGFYAKKLVVPFPLNFAIVSIGSIYLWIGLLSVIAVLFLLVRRKRFTDFFVMGLFLISSGMVVTFSRFAWTPVAERYLYLPCAFFSVGAIGIVLSLPERYRREVVIMAGVLPVLAVFAFATAQRNIVWQDNLALYQDTVRKSPGFAKLKNELAAALKEHGRTAEADALLEAAKSENPSHAFLYVNQADLRLDQGKPDEARKIIVGSFSDKETANPEALKMLARIDEQRFAAARSRTERIKIAREIIDTLDHLYLKTRDPFCLYRAGQLHLFMGKKREAGEYFSRAYHEAPEGIFFKDAAKKLADKFTSL